MVPTMVHLVRTELIPLWQESRNVPEFIFYYLVAFCKSLKFIYKVLLVLIHWFYNSVNWVDFSLTLNHIDIEISNLLVLFVFKRV